MTLQLLWTDASLLRVSALRSRSSRNMITRWWSGDNSSPLLSQMSNTERSKSGDTMQKSMCVCWSKESLPKVHFCTSLCWNKVFIIYSALWQHSYRSLRLSFTSALPCRPIFTPPYCGIVPYVCIEVFQKDRGLANLTPFVASLISPTYSGYSAFAFGRIPVSKNGESSCNFTFNMRILSPLGIPPWTQLHSIAAD